MKNPIPKETTDSLLDDIELIKSKYPDMNFVLIEEHKNQIAVLSPTSQNNITEYGMCAAAEAYGKRFLGYASYRIPEKDDK